MKEYYEKPVGKEYQKVLKKQINGMYQTTKEGRFFYTQGYSYESYKVEVTGLTNEEATIKIREFQSKNFIDISIGILKYLSLREVENRIKEGWKTILISVNVKAWNNLNWVLDNWRTLPENNDEASKIKYDRAKQLANELPNKTYEIEIAGVVGLLGKGGTYWLWDYAKDGFNIDLAGLTKPQMEEKVRSFQMENFVGLRGEDLDAIPLKEIHFVLKPHIESIPKKNRIKAVRNFEWVLKSWGSEIKTQADLIKYDGIKTILEEICEELSIFQLEQNVQFNQPEIEVDARKMGLSKIAQFEKENYPAFYEIFMENHLDKIDLLFNAVKSLKWYVDEKWDSSVSSLAAIAKAIAPYSKLNLSQIQKRVNRRFRNVESRLNPDTKTFEKEYQLILERLKSE